MNAIPPDADFASTARQLARLSIAAAFLSCTLNCVFTQLASRPGAQPAPYGRLVDWASLAMILAGAALGAMGLGGGWRRKSSDTAAIALIGLVLNVGILFFVAWYFTVIRPQTMGR